MTRSPLLVAEDLVRRTPDKVLLDHVSVSVRGGDRIAVVGPTGSGKTLLLRSLAQLDPVDSGTIRWQGREVRGNDLPKFRSQVTYLHQRPAFADATVKEILQQPLTLHVHRGRTWDAAAVRSHLSALGRDESFLARRHAELSGGESQIVALLRVLLVSPQILLLDEATSALDSSSELQFEQLIDDWQAELPAARSVVWVTHNSQQAARVAETRWCIHQGRLVVEECA